MSEIDRISAEDLGEKLFVTQEGVDLIGGKYRDISDGISETTIRVIEYSEEESELLGYLDIILSSLNLDENPKSYIDDKLKRFLGIDSFDDLIELVNQGEEININSTFLIEELKNLYLKRVLGDVAAENKKEFFDNISDKRVKYGVIARFEEYFESLKQG